MKIEFWLIAIAIALTTAVIITVKITAARRKKKRHYRERIYPLW